MANRNPSPETRFKPGQSGNPGGRPAGANRLKEMVQADALADWELHGKAALAELREKDLAAYVRAVEALLPKESKVDIEHSGAIEHHGLPEIGGRVADLLAGRADSDSAALLPH